MIFVVKKRRGGGEIIKIQKICVHLRPIIVGVVGSLCFLWTSLFKFTGGKINFFSCYNNINRYNKGSKYNLK